MASLHHVLSATFLTSILPVYFLHLLPLLSTFQTKKSTSPRSPRKGVKVTTQIVPAWILDWMAAFAAGALLSDAFLHLMQAHSHAEHHHTGMHGNHYVLLGITIFFTMDKLVRHFAEHEEEHHSSHSHACSSNSNSWLPLFADALHNLTDGIAIASSFALSPGIGWKTTIAIFLHEIPHELGDYAVLAKAHVSHEQIIRVQLLTGAVAFLGSVFGHYFGEGVSGLNETAAGGFVYLALAGIVPDVLQSKSIHVLGGFILGVLMMTLLD
jgi:solute carrier family 39 (zinc transporter), member 7